MNWKNLPNPFTRYVTYDITDYEKQPFIQLQPHQIMLNYLKESFMFSSVNMDILIYGDRGFGKTTSLLFFLDFIEKQNNPNLLVDWHKSLMTEEMVMRELARKEIRPTFLEINSFFVHLEKKYGGVIERSNDPVETYHNLDDFFGDRKYYLIIDFPDEVKDKDFKDFLEVLGLIMGSKKTSIIIAMNRPYLIKMDALSHVYGKFDRKELYPFTFNETKQLITKRLEYIANGVGDINVQNVFSDDAIELLRRRANGCPRNIIMACRESFEIAKTDENIMQITPEIVQLSLKENYPFGIIKERISDPVKQESYYSLYSMIKEMGESVTQEKKIIDKANESFNWSVMTIRKRLRHLAGWGLLDIRKCRDNENWNVIKILGAS